MNYSEQFKEHIEYTFAAFCKTVLRNAAITAYCDIGRRRKREISLEYLMEEEYYQPSTIKCTLRVHDGFSRPCCWVEVFQYFLIATYPVLSGLFCRHQFLKKSWRLLC